jgi:hypothetical protein
MSEVYGALPIDRPREPDLWELSENQSKGFQSGCIKMPFKHDAQEVIEGWLI